MLNFEHGLLLLLASILTNKQLLEINFRASKHFPIRSMLASKQSKQQAPDRASTSKQKKRACSEKLAQKNNLLSKCPTILVKSSAYKSLRIQCYFIVGGAPPAPLSTSLLFTTKKPLVNPHRLRSRYDMGLETTWVLKLHFN